MSFARGIGGRMSGRRLLQQAPAFNGNFASLFTPGTVLQSVQSDLGLTYGGTMLAAGTSNTTVATLTGTLTGPYVPVLVSCTTIGVIGIVARFSVSYDGGSTFAMTGVNAPSGTPFALTGAGAGLSVSLSAGTVGNTDNTWKATVSAWADQSGNLLHYSQAGSANQPVITPGLLANPGIGFDGVNDFMSCATFNLPAPGTTPTFIWSVYRVLATPGANAEIVSDPNGSFMILAVVAATNDVVQFNGTSNANGVTAANGTWGRDEAYFSNTAADYHKFGAVQAIGTATGNQDPPAGRFIGGLASVNYLQLELLAMVHANALPSPSQLAALSAAVTAKYGGSVGV